MSEQDNNTLDTILTLHSVMQKQSVDFQNRTIYLNGSINAKSVDKAIKTLHFFETLDSDDIIIRLNSGGGSLYEGLALIDAIRTCECNVIIIATGLCASMAVPILASGDTRYATENTTFMSHELSYSSGFDRLSSQEIETKHSKALDIRINKLLAKYTKKPYSFWSKAGKHTDFFFDADAAIEYGVIDDIVKDIKELIKNDN